MLPSSLCPCANVRRTCRRVLENSPHVSIDQGKLRSLANMIGAQKSPNSIEWDEEGWHYNAEDYLYPEEERRERVALYILALDAINFCFWPSPEGGEAQNTLEYDHLAVALKKLAEADEQFPEEEKQYFFAPGHLATLTPKQMEAALTPHLQGHSLPNMTERCRLWNELGASLILSYEGKALSLVEACGSSAPKLVWLLTREFPGFRDETVWNMTSHKDAMWVAFYKRAQICVGDLNAALELDLEHMDQLTTFADYRVPQVLRHWGVLSYKPVLQAKVDCRVEIDADEETSIRAATVVIVDELVKILNEEKKHDQINAVKLDWHLWQVGEKMNQSEEMKSHHRSRTIFY